MNTEIKHIGEDAPNKLPDNIFVGSKMGTLTITGRYIVDKFQSRSFEAVCDCGKTVWVKNRFFKTNCGCSRVGHGSHKKKRVFDANKRIEKIKRKYIGYINDDYEIIDIVLVKRRRRCIIRCNRCGKTYSDFLYGFLEKSHKCKCRIIKPDYDKIRKEKREIAKEKEKQRIENNMGMYRYVDHTGERHGKLVVVKYLGRITIGKSTGAGWLCKCDCGGEINVLSTQLKHRKYCNKEYIEDQRRKAINTNIKKKNKRNLIGYKTTIEWRDSHREQISSFSRNVYDKYNGVCQKCKKHYDKSQIDAHHMIPLQQSFKSALLLSNGIALCKECHNKFHKKFGYTKFNPLDIHTFLRNDLD